PESPRCGRRPAAPRGPVPSPKPPGWPPGQPAESRRLRLPVHPAGRSQSSDGLLPSCGQRPPGPVPPAFAPPAPSKRKAFHTQDAARLPSGPPPPRSHPGRTRPAPETAPGQCPNFEAPHPNRYIKPGSPERPGPQPGTRKPLVSRSRPCRTERRLLCPQSAPPSANLINHIIPEIFRDCNWLTWFLQKSLLYFLPFLDDPSLHTGKSPCQKKNFKNF